MKILWMTYVLALVSLQETCQEIFGCQTCSTVSGSKSCDVCAPSLFLLKKGETNICVPDCSLVDRNMVNDVADRQCVYMGPFCE